MNPTLPCEIPRLPRLAIAAFAAAVLPVLSAQHTAFAAEPRGQIEAMKAAERGPFSRIRWFCKDGSVLPPEPYACRDHGGGTQHAEWSTETVELRAAGYSIANFYADLDVAALIDSPTARDELAQMLVEQFLVRIDDGWILRRARYYRGAFQEEAERDGARRLLLALVAREEWLTTRYLQLRTVAALLPHGRDTTTAQGIRQHALSLSERDPGFMPLRSKIHSKPAAADAEQVRAYAAGADPALREEFERLSADIERLYASDPGAVLTALLGNVSGGKAARLRENASALSSEDPAARFRASAALLRGLRELLPAATTPDTRVQVLDASIAIEAEHFAAATILRDSVPRLDRRQRLELLGSATDALNGTGFLSGREADALHRSLGRLISANPNLQLYRSELRYLALATDWAAQQLNFHFVTGLQKLAELDPLAMLFTQDQLRGSPLLLYSDIVDGLVRDANRQAGIQARLFGREAGVGVRAVNPGLARGILRDGRGLAAHDFRTDGIYLLPETTAELTPVAGILTAGEGNALSHVQILARSLGIPNVAVAESQLDELMARAGQPAVLAVSPGGTVALMAEADAPAAVLRRHEDAAAAVIRLNLDKLDLGFRELVDLSRLSAADSGRIVGPKAAQLGELKRHFPAQVTDGIAIPFGVFRALLDRPSPDGATKMFDWMAANFRRVEKLPAGSAERAAQTEALRRAIFDWISSAKPDAALQAALRQRLTGQFGTDRGFGVFVRSDTNVEDLPDFTGAGLNLTVPNVVGVDNILEAIQSVWASPFSARAFAWRQSRMAEPEHVYPAILLLKAADVEKSGVLVTADLDTGARDWLSVAVNEGVGGAVDNQAAESLRIHRKTGEIRLMGQATAPFRRGIDPAGGMATLPASGTDRLLSDAEIETLRGFSGTLEKNLPPMVDASGKPAPADVEFGFVGGKLALFQARPFLDNPAAAGSDYLRSLDPDPDRVRGITVDLDGIPQ